MWIDRVFELSCDAVANKFSHLIELWHTIRRYILVEGSAMDSQSLYVQY